MGSDNQTVSYHQKMKITASLIALAAAQAPPESKTCPDCKDWHGAANTLVAAKPNLVKEWAQAVAKEQCQVIWDNDAVCHYFVEGGFVNWVDSWRERMDANSWCSAYAMCSKNDAYAPEPAAKTFSETISTSQSIIPNSSTIFSSRSEKTFATESTRSLDAFSQ